MKHTDVICSVCKKSDEVYYSRVDVRLYKCLHCIRAEVVAAKAAKEEEKA